MNTNKVIKYMKTHPHAGVFPSAYEGDLGFDVAIVHDARLGPREVAQVSLGLHVSVPAGHGFTFMTRSSLVKQGLFVLPTLIDNGYRGPLFLFVVNLTDKHIVIPSGSRVAQILLLSNTAQDVSIQPVSSLVDLGETVRGHNGFGSTGG